MDKTIKKRIETIRQGQVPEGYKYSKLGIIPKDWSVSKLNTILSVQKERNRQMDFNKNNVLSVSGEFGVTNQIELLGRSYAGVSVVDYHIVEHGNLVYTKSPLKTNPYGIIKQNKGKAGIVSTLYAVYHCRDYATGTYLDYYFFNDIYVNNYLRPLVHKGTKNDMKVNNEDVLLGGIILPPIHEIENITKILSCCDQVIKLKKDLLSEKKKRKKSLMQKLLDPTSGFRLPGFSGKWKCFRIEDVADLLTGYPFCSNNFLSNGIKLLRCSNVKRGVVDWKPEITEYWNSAKTIEEYLLKSNDIVIAMDGALIGYSFAQIREGDLPLLLVQRVARLRATMIHHGLLKYLIMNPAFGAYIDAVKTTTAIPHMSPKDILDYKICVPESTTEQQAIADILSAADREIDLLEKELSLWEQKKKSLMQLLLTGIVRVNR